MVSLRDVGTFVESNLNLFSKMERHGIQLYLNDAEHGYYWLKGQKIKHLDDPITAEELDQVIELDRSCKLAYGMTNSWEQGSIHQHDYKFEQLLSVLHHMNTGVSISTKVPVEN